MSCHVFHNAVHDTNRETCAPRNLNKSINKL